MVNCRECGIDFEPTPDEVNQAVDEILETSLNHAVRVGGACPLCGHSKNVPVSHRKTTQFALLLACLSILIGIAVVVHQSRQTERNVAANEALSRLNTSPVVTNVLGSPLTLGTVSGDVLKDETGWNEAQLELRVHGPLGQGTAHVIAGRGKGQWIFDTLEVLASELHKKINVISGSVVEYEPGAYVDVHTQVARVGSQEMPIEVPPPSWNGEYPCIYATVAGHKIAPTLGQCVLGQRNTDPIERYEADLRYGSFVMRETDLYAAGSVEIPLTRTYTSTDWMHPNHVHAFGQNTNHPFDIAPVGSRNPYTYLLILLEDGDFLFFSRVSKGTGYADAVYRHSETSTRYYKSTIAWNGHGWTMKLADGSTIVFPESYNASNMAQGAPTEMTGTNGAKLELHRDGKRDLQEIRSSSGEAIHFTYDRQSRIVRAEDLSQHWATYQYNNDGMLTDVQRSSGESRHFSYDGPLMTSIADETGQVLVRNEYENRTLIGQAFVNGEVYHYQYQNPSNHVYADTVTITMPDKTRRIISVKDSVPNYIKQFPGVQN